MAVLKRFAITTVLAILLDGCAGSSPTAPAPGSSASGGVTAFSAAGQSAAFLTSPAFTTDLDLTPGAQYLIAIVNTDASQATAEDFTLVGTYSSIGSPKKTPVLTTAAGTTPASPVTQKRATVGFARQTASAPHYGLAPAALKRIASFRELQQHHLAMLDRDGQILEDHASFDALRPVNAPRGAPAQPRSALQAVGAVQKIYITKSLNASCTSVDSIGARTVALGRHVIVLADTNRLTWPSALRPDSTFYQEFANEYDVITWPHLLNFIGNPLALDASLSRLDKVTVVISPVLNAFSGGVVSFVDACDFNQVQPGRSLGNHTEMFYYWAPDPARGWPVQQWENLMRATAAHESKHIVSFADRLINKSSAREVTWLEEGLAQESSEIWLRHFNQARWKGHATFDATVGCELDLVASGLFCDASGKNPIALSVSHLPFLFEYLQEESATPSRHGLGSDAPSNYGAGWQFARWATDQYASSEGTFIKALIDEPALSGMPNLAKHAGRSIPELLVYWSLASAIFDTTSYTARDQRTTNPSFDFANIFLTGQTEVGCVVGACALFSFTGFSTPAFPVQPTIDSTTWSPLHLTVTGIPGTAAYYVLLVSPSSGTERLELKNGSGEPISSESALRVGMLRVR